MLTITATLLLTVQSVIMYILETPTCLSLLHWPLYLHLTRLNAVNTPIPVSRQGPVILVYIHDIDFLQRALSPVQLCRKDNSVSHKVIKSQIPCSWPLLFLHCIHLDVPCLLFSGRITSNAA